LGGGDMLEERFKQLRTLHDRYISLLESTFHHMCTEDLVKMSFNSEYFILVRDYINLVCSPEFKENFERVKSQLEAAAQTKSLSTDFKEGN